MLKRKLTLIMIHYDIPRVFGHCPQFCVNRKLQDSGFILESCFQI